MSRNINRYSKWYWIIFSAILFLQGCGTVPPKLEAMMHPQEFLDTHYGYIQIAESRREDILSRLGIPSARFENDRILTYLLVPQTDYNWDIKPAIPDSLKSIGVWEDRTCSLVLVFDEEGVLEKKSLVLPYKLKDRHESTR